MALFPRNRVLWRTARPVHLISVLQIEFQSATIGAVLVRVEDAISLYPTVSTLPVWQLGTLCQLQLKKAMVPSTHGLAPRAVFFDTFALITQPFATTRGACFAPYSRFLFSAPTFIGRIGVRVSSTASSQFTFFINTFPCCSQTFSSTPLISATATIPSTGGTFQYIWSPPWSFTAIPGIVYGIGAVHNTGTVRYGFNTATASAGGITNAVGNGNIDCSLNNVGSGSAAIMIALDDTAITGNE